MSHTLNTESCKTHSKLALQSLYDAITNVTHISGRCEEMLVKRGPHYGTNGYPSAAPIEGFLLSNRVGYLIIRPNR